MAYPWKMPRPKGICPGCGSLIVLTKKGVIYQHARWEWGATRLWRQCTGTGQTPRQEAKHCDPVKGVSNDA